MLKEYKKGLQEFIQLKNGQYMKILYQYFKNNRNTKIWGMDVIVANSKRMCNDCIRKTRNSPKNIYGHKTGRNLGLQPFKIALESLRNFEKTIDNGVIVIRPASKELEKIYLYLKKYGYKEKIILKKNGENELVYRKAIKNK
jgi:hypothetical protein